MHLSLRRRCLKYKKNANDTELCNSEKSIPMLFSKRAICDISGNPVI